jgi:muconolactone D-isomerase
MDFLVHIINQAPASLNGEELQALVKAESARASELADQGILFKLWRIAGKRENVGIWRAKDANELHAALSSLPFFPYLQIEVTPLAEHPNDPRKNL